METRTSPRVRMCEPVDLRAWQGAAAIAPAELPDLPSAPPAPLAPAEAPRRAAPGRLAVGPASAPSPALAGVGGSPKSARILVADDERRIRLAIRTCLEAEGYTVYEAADGAQALEMVLLHAPDLMILDLAMPNLDGMRTLRELQSVHGQLKPRVVMLTAFGSMPAAACAIGLGAAAFVEKPLVPETLRQLVARVLAEPVDADEGLGVPIDWSAAEAAGGAGNEDECGGDADGIRPQ